MSHPSTPLQAVRDVVNRGLIGREPFEIVVRTVGGVALVYGAVHVVNNAQGMIASPSIHTYVIALSSHIIHIYITI